MSKTVRFNKSQWVPEDVVVNSGWNKLFGFGGLFHKTNWWIFKGNSVRWAWRSDHNNEGVFKLAAYCYIDGERHTVELTRIAIDTDFKLSISKCKDGYLFRYGGISHFIDKTGRKPTWKKLGFYHGGEDAAYWDMNCKIK